MNQIETMQDIYQLRNKQFPYIEKYKGGQIKYYEGVADTNNFYKNS